MNTILNISIYDLKINYIDILNNSLLANLLPITLIGKIKSDGYEYFTKIQHDLQKNIAILLFTKANVIRTQVNGDRVLVHSLLPFTDRSDDQLLSEISDDDLITYFIKYNLEVKNLFTTVYKNEYKVAIEIPSVFLDLKSNEITDLQTDMSEYIINIYRKFISTPIGQIPFQPWYGTRIKEYLHTLSEYQVADMLQIEMNNITGSLKSYLVTNDIMDYDVKAEVNVIENAEYGAVEYKILITINEQKYSINIK